MAGNDQNADKLRTLASKAQYHSLEALVPIEEEEEAQTQACHGYGGPEKSFKACLAPEP